MKLDEFLTYDEADEILTIHGVRYARSLFENLGVGAVGATFRIMAREDGILTLQRIELNSDNSPA